MKAKSLLIVLGLIGLAVIANESYGCGQPPTAILDNQKEI